MSSNIVERNRSKSSAIEQNRAPQDWDLSSAIDQNRTPSRFVGDASYDSTSARLEYKSGYPERSSMVVEQSRAQSNKIERDRTESNASGLKSVERDRS
jgi:hypothetical protein